MRDSSDIQHRKLRIIKGARTRDTYAPQNITPKAGHRERPPITLAHSDALAAITKRLEADQ